MGFFDVRQLGFVVPFAQKIDSWSGFKKLVGCEDLNRAQRHVRRYNQSCATNMYALRWVSPKL